MAEAHDTPGALGGALAAARNNNVADADAAKPAKRTKLTDLPKDLLVSIFAAIELPCWVRYTIPLVCKEWAALYRSKDASPLHEKLDVFFYGETETVREQGPLRGRRPITRAAAKAWARRDPVVHASRVISWAERRAGSVRKLRLMWSCSDDIKDFSRADLGALVAVVAPSLTEIRARFGGLELYEKRLWKSLRDSVVPAGRLRSLRFKGIDSVVDESDVGPLAQLAGSLEELVLQTNIVDEFHPESEPGLTRFPASLCALTELRRLVLGGHLRITAIPAGISSLKKLEELDLRWCDLSSLPKELGELSALTRLNLANSETLGTTLPAAEAFPAELGMMRSLRDLDLSYCGLRTVPAFVRELESLQDLNLCGCHIGSFPALVAQVRTLETLALSYNDELRIDAPLDFLIEGCPRLRSVSLVKDRPRSTFRTRLTWPPEALAHIKAFEARLRAERPGAWVSY